MAIRRVGYQTPSGMAGIFSPGRTNIGGIRISPKAVVYGTIALIIVIMILKHAMPAV